MGDTFYVKNIPGVTPHGHNMMDAHSKVRSLSRRIPLQNNSLSANPSKKYIAITLVFSSPLTQGQRNTGATKKVMVGFGTAHALRCKKRHPLVLHWSSVLLSWGPFISKIQ